MRVDLLLKPCDFPSRKVAGLAGELVKKADVPKICFPEGYGICCLLGLLVSSQPWLLLPISGFRNEVLQKADHHYCKLKITQ